jgi:hypothetical protein
VDQDQVGKNQADKEQEEEEAMQEDQEEHKPDTYVVLYDKDWYVGQVVSKEGEPEAVMDDKYVLVTFMKRAAGDLLKWPKKVDMLNVVKEDILFSCQPPTPSAATSSSRAVSYLLTRKDLAKAKNMFMRSKAYYPTKTYNFQITECHQSDCVLVSVRLRLQEGKIM